MNESRRAVAQVCRVVHVWLHRDMVHCVINRLVSCLFLCLGRCERYHEEGQKPPSPKGVNPRSRRTRLLPTSWAHVQKRSRTVRPILFAFRGSRRLWCVNPRTRVSCLMSLRTGDSTSEQVVKGMPLLSLRTGDSTSSLNANAVDESTHSGGLGTSCPSG